jgi:hypothetical protein
MVLKRGDRRWQAWVRRKEYPEVLKIGDGKSSGGSNPSLFANFLSKTIISYLLSAINYWNIVLYAQNQREQKINALIIDQGRSS